MALTLEEKNFTMKHLFHEGSLGSKLIDVFFTKEGVLSPLVVMFRNNWAKEFKKTYKFQVSDRKLDHPVFGTKQYHNSALLHLREDATLRDIYNWISSDIERYISGTDKELFAFEFFSALAEKDKALGKPRMATQKEDIQLGVDIYIPVSKRDGEVVEVKIDIKSNPKDQTETARKNIKMDRDVSTICFKTNRDLARNKNQILRSVKAHAYNGKIFNLNFVRKRSRFKRSKKRKK